MKHVFTLSLLCAALLPTLVFAQWTKLASSTTQNLHDVTFLNANYGVAVGDTGTVLRTTNGGASWQPRNISTKSNLQSVEIIGIDTILVAAGSYFEGEVYRTTNGGNTWTLVAEGIDLEPSGNDYFALNSENILRSSNKGATWDSTGIEIGSTTLLERLHFPSKVGYAIGNVSGFASYSTIGYRTDDAGQTWTGLFSLDFPNANAYSAAAFPDADTGLIFTNVQERFLPGRLNQLTKIYAFYFDESQTQQWRFDSELVNDSLPAYINDAYFFDGLNGYALGANGILYKTTDGGVTFTANYMGTSPLEAIFMLNRSIGYAVGEKGTILKLNLINSTDEPIPTFSLQCYPNPTTGEIRLEGLETSDAILTIFNPMGQILQQKTLNGEQIVNLTNLANGWYLVQVRSEGKWYNGKVIVQK